MKKSSMRWEKCWRTSGTDPLDPLHRQTAWVPDGSCLAVQRHRIAFTVIEFTYETEWSNGGFRHEDFTAGCGHPIQGCHLVFELNCCRLNYFQ